MAKSIFQLKITLENISPPIWRRVLVDSSMTLGDLHLVIQAVMPWGNYHLHLFQKDNKIYSPQISDDDDFFGFEEPDEPEDSVTLKQILKREKSWLRYTYDMGDSWDHKIVLEKTLDPDPKLKYPICIKGKRACPPEDCGGAWRYMTLLEIFSDPSHPEYAEMIEYYPEGIDAEAFDLAELNEALLHREDIGIRIF